MDNEIEKLIWDKNEKLDKGMIKSSITHLARNAEKRRSVSLTEK